MLALHTSLLASCPNAAPDWNATLSKFDARVRRDYVGQAEPRRIARESLYRFFGRTRSTCGERVLHFTGPSGSGKSFLAQITAEAIPLLVETMIDGSLPHETRVHALWTTCNVVTRHTHARRKLVEHDGTAALGSLLAALRNEEEKAVVSKLPRDLSLYGKGHTTMLSQGTVPPAGRASWGHTQPLSGVR